MSGGRRDGEGTKLAALARTTSGGRREPGHARLAEVTVGTVRRLDSGTSPDRHPETVRWPDDRRPRPRRVDSAATPVADALRLRMRDDSDRRAAASPPIVPRPAEGAAPTDDEDRPRRRARRDAVEANARLTGSTAAVLLVLLAVEGFTILEIHPLLTVHVFVGMLVIPPVLLKIGSTGWRFARYYLGDPAYRRKGPPATVLRLLGPAVVVLTVAVLATGVALLFVSPAWRTRLLLAHKVSFVLWFAVMVVHVLGHVLDTAKLAPRDWYWRTRRQVAGASSRQWLVATAVVLGLIVGALTLPHVGSWVSGGHPSVSGPNRP